MKPFRRTRSMVVAMSLSAVLAACGSSSGPTSSPGTTASAVASAPASSGTTPPPASASHASPPVATAAACPVTEQTGMLPSDRLVDLSISSTPTHDLLTFVFAPSTPGPGGPPQGTLSAARPPFSFAGSGQEFPLLGQHAIQLRFSAMTIASESGEATYHGPVDVKPGLPALREAIQFDASEGIVAWYVGYDGPGCVTLVREGNDVTVMIAHAEAPAG
jgi:hypothetical protein